MAKQLHFIFLALLLLSPASTILAQATHAAPEPAELEGPTDPAEVEDFIDATIARQMRDAHIVGATVSVVVDGEVFFAKGYGYANLSDDTPVSADETIFRVGSVSKVFVWTAVMQLAEQGVLDLDTDVNDYLTDFQIPATYPQPITLKHLMTHTAGFEERNAGTVGLTFEDLRPLGDVVANELPARVRPPGEMMSYSNYGAALAAYIVEQVSGMPFEQYAEEHIFEPLDMSRSTFRQPVTPELMKDMAIGYSYANGTYQVGGIFQVGEFEYVDTAPTGAMSTTAVDMAHFMIAHLQGGRYGDERILQSASIQDMHHLQFTNDPRLDGMTYGFFESNMNNQHVISHGGTIELFSSELVLLPEQGIGLFTSYSGSDAVGKSSELLQAFMHHYYPAPKWEAAQAPPDTSERVDRITGLYRSHRSAYTTFEKALGWGLYDVSANRDGTLRVFGIKHVEVEPLVFRDASGEMMLIFRENERGHITHMLSARGSFEKLTWYETPAFGDRLRTICELVFLSALVSWPISAFIKRRKEETRSPPSSGMARWLAAGACALNLLFLAGWALLRENVNPALPVFIVYLRPLLTITLIGVVATGGTIVFAAQAWKNAYWSVVGRAHYTLVALALLAFTWWLNHWNLLGWRF